MFEKFNNGLWNMSKKSETVENVQVDLKNKQKKKKLLEMKYLRVVRSNPKTGRLQ